MKALNGKDEPRESRRERQRKGLLAKVHIAYKEIGYDEYIYKEILSVRYGKGSARDMSVAELEDLVAYFKHLGWKQKSSKLKAQSSKRNERRKYQTEQLRERAWALAEEIENGAKRLAGLAKKICGAERIEWCHEVPKLKRVLAVLEKIKGRGQGAEGSRGQGGI